MYLSYRALLRPSCAMLIGALIAACSGGDNAAPAAGQRMAQGGIVQGGAPEAKKKPQPVACADMSGQSVPASSIGLPTGGASVTSAMVVTPAEGTPYCQVLGKIVAAVSAPAGTPDIRFQLNLPVNWKGKAVQFGGAGYGGVVADATGAVPFAPGFVPLQQRFATYGSDTGHVGGVGSAEFALNEAAIANFGYEHLKKTHDAAFALIQLHYAEAPSRSYFAGGSTGGREGLTAIQRYPDDYDGVVVSAPAINFAGVRLHGVKVGQAAYGAPGGYLNQTKQALVHSTVLAHCDADDGLQDSIVGNVAACRTKSAAILAALRCVGGADLGDSCLSDAQLNTVHAIADDLLLPYQLAHGVNRHHGYNILQGANFAPAPGLGSSPVLGSPPNALANGYLFAQGDGYIKYFITKNAAFNSINFDIANPGAYQQRLVDMSGIVGATNPDLDAFRGHGGKLIVLHGLADEVISPNATIAYYQAHVAKMGQHNVNKFMRFYTVPGLGHSVGTFVPSWNAVDILDDWVSKGEDPETLKGVDVNAATAGRSRPLCRYPEFPRYKGHGDVSKASSYQCVTS
jgi:pimeloyl-ACP methyl ester carboxylesterase